MNVNLMNYINIRHLQWILVLSIIVLNTQTKSQSSEEGDPCETKRNESGICTKQSKCNILEQQIKNRITKVEDVVSCGFSLNEEVICCPNKSDYPTIIPKERPAVRACQEIEKNLGKPFRTQIINGVETDLGQFPHMAAIGYTTLGNDNGPYEYACAGSLIHKKFVLTAAHCVVLRDRKPAIVLLGVVDISNKQQLADGLQIRINSFVVHPDFSEMDREFNFALLELKEFVNFTKNIYPSCLYAKDEKVDDYTLRVVSWSMNENDQLALLKYSEAQLTLYDFCMKKYVFLQRINQSPKSFICIESTDYEKFNPLLGSGGPANLYNKDLHSYSIVGVSISNFKFGYNDFFANITHGLEFIEEVVWKGK